MLAQGGVALGVAVGEHCERTAYGLVAVCRSAASDTGRGLSALAVYARAFELFQCSLPAA